MNELKHVTEWCAAYSEKKKLKIFPQSAPLLAIIDDLLLHAKMQESVINKLCEQFHLLEYKFNQLDERLSKPQEKLTKTAPKVDKKEVKK